MSDLFNVLQRAYKKLKASIYFDKTQLILRNKIVMYEGDDSKKFDEKLRKLAEKLIASEREWTEYENRLLDTIKVLAFPKRVTDDNNENLIRNDCSESIEIERAQYFFDMDVEGQLLGVLWILYFGIDIDENLYKNSYGNRLKQRVKKEGHRIDEYLTFSPYLFKPYYNQYENWRDYGLKLAQDYLDKKQDILIITMDFKDFYHSVDFSQKEFSNFYDEYCKEHNGAKTDFKIEKRINMFVFRCIKKYSGKFNKKRIFLPIGFLPSNILSNLYLDKFDKEIINKWNPLYYGRYVDDIIIVDKVEKNSPVINLLNPKSESDKKEGVLEYYLCGCKNDIGKGCKNNMFLLIRDETQKDNKQGEVEIVYKVNKKIFNDKSNSRLNPEIILQNSKVKVFYFNYKESDALITCFRKTIRENKSEFRFLPEDGSVFYDDDYSEIYDVRNYETINKFRGIDGIFIDKYALSKFLGKYLRIGSLITDKKESKFVKDINKIFNSKTITENYLVWEKVLQFFIVNNKIDSFIKFVETIKCVVDKVSVSAEIREIECSITDTLSDFLFSAVVRSLSLCWGKKIKREIVKVADIFKDRFTTEIIMEYRKNYCRTRMVDKHLMPLLIDTVIEDKIFLDDEYFNLCYLNTFRCASNLTLEKGKYKYYPYMITPQDISLCLAFSEVMSDSLIKNFELINRMKRKYVEMNYNYSTDTNNESSFLSTLESKSFLKVTDKGNAHKENTDKFNEAKVREKASIIKVGDKKKQLFKIAVTSAAVSNSDFVGVLTDKVNRSFSRYNKLSKVINQAIKNKADILVLPEAYVPYEWIPLIARKCANAGMAIITGIEHIKSQKSIYNLTATILPYNVEEYTFSYIGFHTKVHYSPEEERQIKGYGFEAKHGDMYDLFLWNDLWFATYCCYELASIRDRCMFSSYVDMLAMVECNKDVNYYSNIIESLSRDMHCYCVQVNSSEYGDSRITQPAKTEIKDIIKTKGGTNETILIGEIDINKLRNFQIKGYELQKDDNTFKPTPPQLDIEVVKKKIKGSLFSDFSDI